MKTNNTWVAAMTLSGVCLIGGCIDTTPPPAQGPIPSASNPDAPITRSSDYMKPLPPSFEVPEGAQPPFYDPPIVRQEVPEQPQFVDAYHKVGSPRIVIFVNRTLDGNVIPAHVDPFGAAEPPRGGSGDHVEASGAGEYRDGSNTYLRPGQYDEASIDYGAIEASLTDWLSCNGQVTIISPTVARQRLTEDQVKQLQAGNPQVMGDLAQTFAADVLVQVQAHPTRRTEHGVEVRIIAEAINTKGGESIGRSVVDVPPPLSETTINVNTRFLARKLMDEMLDAWSAPPPAPERPPARPGESGQMPAPAPESAPVPTPTPAPMPVPAPPPPVQEVPQQP